MSILINLQSYWLDLLSELDVALLTKECFIVYLYFFKDKNEILTSDSGCLGKNKRNTLFRIPFFFRNLSYKNGNRFFLKTISSITLVIVNTFLQKININENNYIRNVTILMSLALIRLTKPDIN